MSKSGSYDLSDDEILRIKMHYGDPRDGFDLLSPEEVPEVPKWVSFIGKYKCKDAVKCMRPTCGQLHNEGAVVEIIAVDQSPGLINIGHVCGEQLFSLQLLRVGRYLDRRGISGQNCPAALAEWH